MLESAILVLPANCVRKREPFVIFMKRPPRKADVGKDTSLLQERRLTPKEAVEK